MWETIDSTTSEYWRTRLDGLSYDALMRGCDEADLWTGSKANFTVGVFKKMCKRPIADPSHKLYEALEVIPMEAEEMHKRRAKMKQEQGI